MCTLLYNRTNEQKNEIKMAEGFTGTENTSHVISDVAKTLENVPLRSLNRTCRHMIALRLDNGEGVCITTSDGEMVLTNWEGLAELAGFGHLEIQKCGREKSPTVELLQMWGQRFKDPKPDICNFLKFLVKMQREDVITDCLSKILEDVAKFKDMEEKQLEIHTNPVSQPRRESNLPDTVDSVATGETHYYDAFVIFNPRAQKDFEFVQELIDKYEGSEHNLKLFIPWRDSLPGGANNTITAEIIEKLCRRCLVVISKSFYDCDACDFQLKYVQSLSPGARSKRVVPLLTEDIRVPNILNFVGPAPFYNPNIRAWQWTRVAATLKSELDPDPEKWDPTFATKPSDITMDVSSLRYKRLWSLGWMAMDMDDESIERMQEAMENDESVLQQNGRDINNSANQQPENMTGNEQESDFTTGSSLNSRHSPVEHICKDMSYVVIDKGDLP